MALKHIICALLGSACLTAGARAQELGPVVITEIMYNPQGADEGQEWVEVYNPTGATVNLSGWALLDNSGATTAFAPGTALAPGALAVIAPRRGGVSGNGTTRASTYVNSQASFDSAWGPGLQVIWVESFWNYPGDPVPITGTLDGLTNSPTPTNNHLRLVNALSQVIDEVNYDDDEGGMTPWPDDNDSGSIQLIRPFIGSVTDNNNGAAWRLSRPTDPWGSWVAGQALPAFPGLLSCGTPGRLPFPQTLDCNGNGIYDPVEIVHGLAVDSYPFNNLIDACEGDCNGDGQPDLTQIALNWQLDRNANRVIDACEINAHGGSGGVGGAWDTNFNGVLDSFENKPNVLISEILYNPAGDDEGKEFVEIYNAGATAVDISGWALKDLEDTATGAIPAGTAIQPHEAIVLIPGSGPGVPADIAAQFRAAWSLPASVRTFALNPWQDRAQQATSIEEVLALMDASGQPVDVVDYENPQYAPGSVWPDDDGASSITLLPTAMNKTANDNGANWARSMTRIDGAYDSLQTGFFTDIRGTGSTGSPGIVWTGPHQTQTGQAVITELMYHPNSDPGDVSRAEWVEVYNPGASTLDLSGWFLRDEDGRTAAIPGATLLPAGQLIVLVPRVLATSAAAAESDFRAAWGNICRVVSLTGWSDSEAIPNIGGLSNSPDPGNEILTLRRADGVVVDIVNYDDDGSIWPADAGTAPPGQGTGWSIYLLPGHYSATENDLGQNWAAGVQGIDLARLNNLTAVFNGFDVGSPGLLQGVVSVPQCTAPPPCYPNCDNSTTPPILNTQDFTCFLQRFSASDPYANCDGSTMAPIFNILDFTCFMQRMAAGCP